MMQAEDKPTQGAILSPGRRRKIFFTVLAAHLMVFSLPAVMALIDDLTPKEAVFEISLIDGPSTPNSGDPAPPSSEAPSAGEPTPEPPTPEPPTPEPPPPGPPTPEPEVPSPPMPVPSEPIVGVLPRPKPRPVTEPQAPKLPTVTKTDDRSLDKKPPKPAPSSNRPKNDWKPVSPGEITQTGGSGSGSTSSATGGAGGSGGNSSGPAGGAKADQYIQKLAGFLKLSWNPPSRADLGDRKPMTEITLSISATGQVTSARISKPSGVAVMDAKVKAFLAGLASVPAPPEGKPVEGVRFILTGED